MTRTRHIIVAAATIAAAQLLTPDPIYAQGRGAPTPALNALATVALLITLATLTLAYLVYRKFAGGEDAASVATLEV